MYIHGSHKGNEDDGGDLSPGKPARVHIRETLQSRDLSSIAALCKLCCYRRCGQTLPLASFFFPLCFLAFGILSQCRPNSPTGSEKKEGKARRKERKNGK